MVGGKGKGFVAVALCGASGGMRRSAGVCGLGARQGRMALVVLTLEEDEAMLFQARLNDVRMFYVGFAFRGEVAYGCSGGKTVFGYEQPASMFVRQAASG